MKPKQREYCEGNIIDTTWLRRREESRLVHWFNQFLVKDVGSLCDKWNAIKLLGGGGVLLKILKHVLKAVSVIDSSAS